MQGQGHTTSISSQVSASLRGSPSCHVSTFPGGRGKHAAALHCWSFWGGQQHRGQQLVLRRMGAVKQTSCRH